MVHWHGMVDGCFVVHWLEMVGCWRVIVMGLMHWFVMDWLVMDDSLVMHWLMMDDSLVMDWFMMDSGSMVHWNSSVVSSVRMLDFMVDWDSVGWDLVVQGNIVVVNRSSVVLNSVVRGLSMVICCVMWSLMSNCVVGGCVMHWHGS